MGDGERFKQDLMGMEKRYQGKWNALMLECYQFTVGTLRRDAVDSVYKGQGNIISHFMIYYDLI